jgi:hypothetical protein
LFGLNFALHHRAKDMGCGDKKVFCLKGSPEITNGLNKAHVPVSWKVVFVKPDMVKAAVCIVCFKLYNRSVVRPENARSFT